MRAHCLFEQSGTFKNEFKKLGIEAYDYDIRDDFGETDFVVDLFAEIEKSYSGGASLFDSFDPDDVVMAFFPCTMFQDKNALIMSGRQYQMGKYSLSKKMQVCIDRHIQIHTFYTVLCKLVKVFADRGLRLIIENPATQPHYLSMYWIPPTFVDKDRTKNGDYYKKPTQYWFIGFEPQNNILFEPIEFVETNIVERVKRTEGIDRQVMRSMIHPQYANRFIRQYILPAEK